MKKIIKILSCFFIVFLSVNVCLAFDAGSDGKIMDMQKERSGYEGLSRNIPEFALDVFDAADIDGSDIDATANELNFNMIIKMLAKTVSAVFKNDIGLFLNIIMLCMLCAVYNSAKGTFLSDNMSRVYSCVVASCVILCIITPVHNSLGGIISVIEQLRVFIKSSMPVYVTLTASAGYVGSASVINGIVLVVCDVFASVMSSLLVPVTSVFFALGSANIIFQNKFINTFSGFIKRCLTVIIGASLTLFVGIMSLKNIISQSADTLGKRTVKFAMGNMIPVAGGMISEAMETVYSCSGVLKSTAGVFGMVVIISAVLMPIAALVSKIVFFKAANLICELFGCDELTSFMQITVDGLFIALTILITISIMLILCITLVIMTGR